MLQEQPNEESEKENRVQEMTDEDEGKKNPDK